MWRNGRRDRLKICFTQVSGGSSPSTGTLFQTFDIKNIFTPEGVALIKKANPHQKLNIITVQSLNPFSITLTKPDGTMIDLTPIFKDACNATMGAR